MRPAARPLALPRARSPARPQRRASAPATRPACAALARPPAPALPLAPARLPPCALPSAPACCRALRAVPCAPCPRPCACLHAQPRARPACCHAQPSAQCHAQWAVAIQVLYHFFFLFFFFFISFIHWKIPKNIYLFSFIFQYTNKFIKIYFIYIYIYIFFFHSPNKPNKLLKLILLILLFQFTHCKLQGLFSNMPMCSLPKHTNIHITHTTYHTHQTHTYNHSSIRTITHKTHMPCPSFVPCLS